MRVPQIRRKTGVFGLRSLKVITGLKLGPSPGHSAGSPSATDVHLGPRWLTPGTEPKEMKIHAHRKAGSLGAALL